MMHVFLYAAHIYKSIPNQFNSKIGVPYHMGCVGSPSVSSGVLPAWQLWAVGGGHGAEAGSPSCEGNMLGFPS